MNTAVAHTLEEVVAAACAATRVNNGYFKMSANPADENGVPVLANKVLLLEILSEPSLITEEDRTKSEDVIRHWRGLSFTALSRQLNEFETNILEYVSAETVYPTDKLAIGIISYLPAGYEKASQRRDIDETIRMASDEPVADIGKAFITPITVLKVSGPYSYDGDTEKYLHVATTDKNQVVRFYYKKELSGKYTIKAKVKNKRDDGSTQINYVIVL